MNKNKSELLNAKELRVKAEEMNRTEDALHIIDVDTLSKIGIKTLIHELQVHQIELELQNDELRQIQIELEASRSKYFSLYNLSPVGYITLDDNGIIRDVNLTFCNLLSHPRQFLINKPITQFIQPEDQDIFYKFKKLLTATGAQETCELRLITREGKQYRTYIAATRDCDKDSRDFEYHCVFTNAFLKKNEEENQV